MTSKIRIILHGKQAGNEALRTAVERVRERGHDIDVRVTWEAGDTRSLAREAALAGIHRVVAGGGDGTLNEVVNGLDAADVPSPSLGVLPLGTANDFACSAGIPVDLESALLLCAEGPCHPIDIVQGRRGCFINVATGGYGTEVTVNTDPALKRVLGGAAYFVTGITRFFQLEPIEARIIGPGLLWEGALAVVAIGNGRSAGGGHELCPDAAVDDGLLDVAVLPNAPDGHQTVLEKFMLEGSQAVEAAFLRWRVPELELHSEHGIYVNMDGEPCFDTLHRFCMRGQRLGVHLPDDSPLLSRNSKAGATASPLDTQTATHTRNPEAPQKQLCCDGTVHRQTASDKPSPS